MGFDIFRLGVAIILLSIMFPLIEIVDRYCSSGTTIVMFFLWLIGVLLILASAFAVKNSEYR